MKSFPQSHRVAYNKGFIKNEYKNSGFEENFS